VYLSLSVVESTQPGRGSVILNVQAVSPGYESVLTTEFTFANGLMVYLIGLVFCCGGLTYVVVQKNSGKSVWSAVPTLDPATLDPKSSVQMKKLAVTPDTTYSGSA
jgi:hypothetical protein